MNCLITGANGMLGSDCVRLLAPHHHVLATDIADKICQDVDAEYFSLDITNAQSVKKMVQHYHPDVIVNCAGFTNVDGAERDKKHAWDINVEGVRNLADALEPLGGHIIHLSTDYVFDGQSGPYDEEQEPEPLNYYGETKLASEKIISDLKIDWTILRTNVLFGGIIYQKASFVDWVIQKLKHREPINIVNDQYGNPTWSYSLANAIKDVIEKRGVGLYNFAGKDYINRLEFALKIAGIFGLDPQLIRPITTRSLNQLAKRPFKSGLITDKIVTELNVKIDTITEALVSIKQERENH